MTDLEITKLCAEAMGYVPDGPARATYDPLHDDAQAMALVKRFRLRIDPMSDMPEPDAWGVHFDMGIERPPFSGWGNLNRAICLCVAQMQQTKATAKV